tara:strand:- start:1476 stop:2570 length:1095 start_codon:yes stop_codon:yes gene_type:complete
MNFDDAKNIRWMKRALNLASLGRGNTSPNPLVGAVILDKNGKLISEGFHSKAGKPHAEAMAFNNITSDPQGGTLYVNLEPCCHHGKTPPCVEAVINSGIKKVYVAMKDPDPRVSGKSIKLMENAGIVVNLGLCNKEALEINKSFIFRNLTGKSYGVLKWAMSLDGRISLKNGESKWISNQSSRSFVHSLRSDYDAVIVGGNTLRTDNPILTTRGGKNPEPLRVVFTKTLDLPENCNLWDCEKAKTLVLYDSSTANEKYLKRIPSCVEVDKLPSDDPSNLSKFLAKKGCNKVLWECGPKLATAAIKNGSVQELFSFISPKILGGINSNNPISDLNFKSMDEVIELLNIDLKIFNGDICLNSLLKN